MKPAGVQHHWVCRDGGLGSGSCFDLFAAYGQMEGKHLSLVIAMNLFVSIIPLLILGYAFLEAFNPHRSFGTVVVHAFHLTGNTARTVENTFTTANSGKSTALSISIISLLITGLDISATVQLAYARAFGVTPLSGLQKYLRGATWLLLLLAATGGSLALRYLVVGRPPWVLILSSRSIFSCNSASIS